MANDDDERDKDKGKRAARLGQIPATALSLSDAAAVLNLSVRTLLRLRRRGEGPKCFRIGGAKLYVLREDLDAWLRERARVDSEA